MSTEQDPKPKKSFLPKRVKKAKTTAATGPKIKPRDKPHYVNNTEFSAAVVAWVALANEATDKGEIPPVVPAYVATCFVKLSEGLSHKSNFVRYTYREDMVGDGIENCLRAIRNYNIEAATRSGKPNAFGYFTQIIWFAFLRRIKKEKDQQEIKMKAIASVGLHDVVSDGGIPSNGFVATSAFVDQLKDRIDQTKAIDIGVKHTPHPAPRSRRRRKSADSDLSDFIG